MAHRRPTHTIPALFTALVLASFPMAAAATAPIYRCQEPGKGVAYQDFPCANGVVVDIRPGAPNAEAITRLERQQEAFDQRYARLRAEELAAREAAMARGPRYSPPADEPPVSDYAYLAYPYGYGGFVTADRPRHHRDGANDNGFGRRPKVGHLPATIHRPHR
jgi:hypothetical protein